VTRTEDAADRRAKILSLTDAGRSRVTEIERLLAVLRADLLSDVGDAELSGALLLLGRLEAKLTGPDTGE
jgi:MarR family transcriptional regulator for hemolysin